MKSRSFLLVIAYTATLCTLLQAQGVPGAPEPAADPLNRVSPRSTVVEFLTSARGGNYVTASQYLDTTLRGARAAKLAEQLYVVLDRRLPARLNQVSPRREGSRSPADPPDTELVGTIESVEGPVDITLQRIQRDKSPPVWMFSKDTLKAVPALYEEVNHIAVEEALPAFLTQQRIFGVPLLQWLVLFVGIPLVYFLIGFINSLLVSWVGLVWRKIRRQPAGPKFQIASRPVRLLLVVLVLKKLVSSLNLTLIARQLWASIIAVLTIVAFVWLVIGINGWLAKQIRKRLSQRGDNSTISVLPLVRRTLDLVALLAGAFGLLSYFNLNVTAALAGLGVGGIAVALAAQKTLENVIGGISIIADKAVRVGSTLKIANATGTIEAIGLRSTRIRTMDRSVVSIPNAQIANESLEEFSCRDKYWFHPLLRLRYETTADQLRSVMALIYEMLQRHSRVELDSPRVRFLLFGSSSLDVEVYAYILCPDFGQFLAIQEELLLRIMDIVEGAGTAMALPVQETYVTRTEKNSPDARKDAIREQTPDSPALP